MAMQQPPVSLSRYYILFLTLSDYALAVLRLFGVPGTVQVLVAIAFAGLVLKCGGWHTQELKSGDV